MKKMKIYAFPKCYWKCWYKQEFMYQRWSSWIYRYIRKSRLQICNHMKCGASVIKNKLKVTTPFLFNSASLVDIETKKAGAFQNILPKFLKKCIKFYSETLKQIFIDTVISCEFPSELKKIDDLTKEEDPTKAWYYTPLSAPSFVSQVFERIMAKQISEYVIRFLSPCLCRLGYSTCDASDASFSTQQIVVVLRNKHLYL